MSKMSLFTTGPLANVIGPYNNNDIVDTILDGTVTHELLGISPLDVDVELDALLTSLQYDTTSNENKIGQMDNMISLVEGCIFFKIRRTDCFLCIKKYIWVTILPRVNEIYYTSTPFNDECPISIWIYTPHMSTFLTLHAIKKR